jgi:hypothetical protein
MQTNLMDKHRDEIRRGMKDANELESAIQMMVAGTESYPASLRELRFLYGARPGTGFDTPLTPLAMAKVLQEKFGAENFSSALGSLRTKMATGFRREQRKSANPRLWLCLSDAAAFNALQSAHAIAADLRKNLMERAQVMPQASTVSMSVSLMSLAESGRGKVASVVTQIYDGKDANGVMKAQVYLQVQHAMRMLPMTMWPADRSSQRVEVIDELGKQARGAFKEVTQLETPVERNEHVWRETLVAGRKPKCRCDAVCLHPGACLRGKDGIAGIAVGANGPEGSSSGKPAVEERNDAAGVSDE